jgi:probable dihydroxyacetone kinase regulator
MQLTDHMPGRLRLTLCPPGALPNRQASEAPQAKPFPSGAGRERARSGGGAKVSDSNITKLALANSLKALMARKPFEKICVNDIVSACALTRQTFYYHFQDKYDLMHWIYYTETARFMSEFSAPEQWTEGLISLCRYMQANGAFYRNALNTTGQNSFPEYLYGYIRSICLSAVEHAPGEVFDGDDWDFFAQFFSMAFVSFIVRWSNEGMKADPAGFIRKIRRLYDGSVLAQLKQLGGGPPAAQP